MSKDLTIPKRGDLVVCIRGGFIANNTVMTAKFRYEDLKELAQGTMGVVTCARRGHGRSDGTLSITWFDGLKTKHYLHGSWARNVGGWKQWLRVVEHKQ
jgi:hypothetical protein